MKAIFGNITYDHKVKHMFSLVVLFFLCSWITLTAQERVFMYLKYYQTNDARYLRAEMKYRKDRVFYQLGGQEVSFYQATEDDQLLLGKVSTGEDGFARLNLDNNAILWDSTGYTHFLAEYEGNEEFRSADRDLDIKRTELKMMPEVVDSTYQLTINGYEFSDEGKSAIDGEDVRVLVKRLYSDLPVREGSLEDGVYVTDFPNDIPGKSRGELEIIARIQDHDDYGTVEARDVVRWGVPVSFVPQERPRALWARAPLWIIIGVWGALIVAWFHYLLAISNLFGMKDA